MVAPTAAPLPMVGSHRMLFQTTGPTLFDIGVICAGILTLTSLIPGPAVMGQSSTRDTTFSQGLSIFLKSLLASTLVVVAFNSVILVLIFVIVATRCAVPAVRGRRARQDAEQDDDIEVASFIDRRDAGGDDGAETVDDKDNDPNDKENRDVFPITFAGFLAYFVDEARQPTKAFADTGEEIKTATPAAPSLEGRTA
ncbi:hypothetical protein B0A48_05833 [Cryoendolithus antarcticus]|uniref:Uncharacterized protein n=1 Tax=Cryoendolithus antarcticus TaxID=1507870 RepID=A0A1V8TC39_9PEZI|nr:hypothetical protein B0A48_05833 [Cryoendolithus antarcticus]